jgi:hypothetical protein
MRRCSIFGVFIAIAFAFDIGCDILRIPDLTVSEASHLISRAPEFNRYARLLQVERLDHLKDSMDSVSYGLFSFVYLNSPPDAKHMKGWADFRYWDREWHLNAFDYGCNHSALYPELRATDCHSVQVYNPPPR